MSTFLPIDQVDLELNRLILPSEAVQKILRVTGVLPAEEVPLMEVSGRTLAEDAVADFDFPPFPAATMDGFAILADDGSPWREILGRQAAGSPEALEVTPGTAVKIMTGAPLPKGADAVVRVEATEIIDDHVVIHQDHVTPGDNLRPIGSDFRKGEILISGGTRLGPAEIGILASLGLAEVPVRRRPRVSVISTGDELVEPGQPLKPGQIRDSNRFSLVAALQDEGAEVVFAGKGPDEREALESLLRQSLDSSDVVITTGGVSMGELDLVKLILDDIATVHFRRLFMKPGKPLSFATTEDQLIFGLSGNPVSALVSFENFIKPALRKLSGRTELLRKPVPVRLEHAVFPSDRIDYQRAKISVGPDGSLNARTTGSQASSRLASFVDANALLIVDPRDHEYAPGEVLTAVLTGEIGPAT